jgi:hypothetical protein
MTILSDSQAYVNSPLDVSSHPWRFPSASSWSVHDADGLDAHYPELVGADLASCHRPGGTAAGSGLDLDAARTPWKARREP